MGCCLSSTHNSHNPKPDQNSSSTPPDIGEEEEAIVVKEVVISESPKKIPELPKKIPELPNSPLLKSPIPSSPESPIDPLKSQNRQADVITELEDVSFTDESLSTSTAKTATSKRREKIEDEEEEVVGPPPSSIFRKKGFSGDLSGAGGRVRRERAVAPARGNVGPAKIRQGPGEERWLRSRSPATGRGGGRGRRAVRRGLGMRTGTPGCRSFDGTVSVRSRRVVEERNDGVSGSFSESFENPLVSLECFIFL